MIGKSKLSPSNPPYYLRRGTAADLAMDDFVCEGEDE